MTTETYYTRTTVSKHVVPKILVSLNSNNDLSFSSKYEFHGLQKDRICDLYPSSMLKLYILEISNPECSRSPILLTGDNVTATKQ